MEIIDIGKIYVGFGATFSKTHSLRFWPKVPFLPKDQLVYYKNKLKTLTEDTPEELNRVRNKINELNEALDNLSKK